jgi:cell division septum initiation protein DivIVA
MAASILNSPKAIEMSVYVVRAFVRLRDLLASNKALAQKLEELEHKLKHHDDAITAILSAIRQLMNSPAPKGRGIGFTAHHLRKGHCSNIRLADRHDRRSNRCAVLRVPETGRCRIESGAPSKADSRHAGWSARTRLRDNADRVQMG